MNAHASDTTIIITFDSQAHVIQEHKYWTKWETFHFALLAWNLVTQEIKSTAWSQLSVGQVFGKLRIPQGWNNGFALTQVCYIDFTTWRSTEWE